MSFPPRPFHHHHELTGMHQALWALPCYTYSYFYDNVYHSPELAGALERNFPKNKKPAKFKSTENELIFSNKD